MATINMQCKSISQIHYILRYLLYAESCLSGRAYVGEVLTQIWLKSMQKMSELLDKQVYGMRQ